ncbi:MAG: hypothetical protein ACTS73_07715 [Arsenophonus sp. NEOnobi-MAG3]
MMMSLYRQATTTPKPTTAFQASKEPASTLPKRYGISELPIPKWKKRDDIDDRLCWQRLLLFSKRNL